MAQVTLSTIDPTTAGWATVANSNFTALKDNIIVGPLTKAALLLLNLTTYTNRYATITDPAASKGRLTYCDGTNWRYVSDDSIVS